MLEIPADSSTFGEVMALYRDLFRADERLSEDRIRELMDAGEMSCLVLQEKRALVAFALLFISPKDRFAHLDYFGVQRKLQNLGIGSRLLRNLLEYLKSDDRKFEWMLLEVGDDEARSDERWSPDRRRRIRFYERHGARRLKDVKYLFPGYDGKPIPMSLMVVPFLGQDEIVGNQVRAMITRLYTGLHRRSPEDPSLLKVLGEIPEKVSLNSRSS